MKVRMLVLLAALVISCTAVSCGQPADPETQMNETMANETLMPSISVSDQMIEGDQVIGNVTIDEVVSNGTGWVAIHNNLFEHPGGIIGYAQVENGTTENVTVTIHTFVATDSLFAVLHMDAGEEGVFEYPAPDTEQMADGQLVILPFKVTGNNFTLMNLTATCQENLPEENLSSMSGEE